MQKNLAGFVDFGYALAMSSPHYDLICNVFEATRSLYGYKPSWSGLEAMSLTELQTEYQRLCDSLDAQSEWEREYDERAAAEQAYQDQLDAYELSLTIEGEPQFVNGCWEVR